VISGGLPAGERDQSGRYARLPRAMGLFVPMDLSKRRSALPPRRATCRARSRQRTCRAVPPARLLAAGSRGNRRTQDSAGGRLRSAGDNPHRMPEPSTWPGCSSPTANGARARPSANRGQLVPRSAKRSNAFGPGRGPTGPPTSCGRPAPNSRSAVLTGERINVSLRRRSGRSRMLAAVA